MAQGWECPKCGRCYAPTVTQCSGCVGVSPAAPYVQPYVRYVPYVPGSTGTAFCSACGQWFNGSHVCWTVGPSGGYTPPQWTYATYTYPSNTTNEVVNG